jgi:hypothetical protein
MGQFSVCPSTSIRRTAYSVAIMLHCYILSHDGSHIPSYFHQSLQLSHQYETLNTIHRASAVEIRFNGSANKVKDGDAKTLGNWSVTFHAHHSLICETTMQLATDGGFMGSLAFVKSRPCVDWASLLVPVADPGREIKDLDEIGSWTESWDQRKGRYLLFETFVMYKSRWFRQLTMLHQVTHQQTLTSYLIPHISST